MSTASLGRGGVVVVLGANYGDILLLVTGLGKSYFSLRIMWP